MGLFPDSMQCNGRRIWQATPCGLFECSEKLGIEKQECIVIEDSVTGLIAAKAANLTTFLVNTDYQNEKFSIADKRMASLLDVIEKLKQH